MVANNFLVLLSARQGCCASSSVFARENEAASREAVLLRDKLPSGRVGGVLHSHSNVTAFQSGASSGGRGGLGREWAHNLLREAKGREPELQRARVCVVDKEG